MISIFLSLVFTVPSVQALNFYNNVPVDLRKQLIADLDASYAISGEQGSDLHTKIFGGPTNGKSYQKFFNQRIHNIGLHNCGSTSAIACVIPAMSSDSLYITPVFLKFSHPQLARIMVLYHESRHAEPESSYNSHANCPIPFRDQNGNDHKSLWSGALLQGNAACDTAVTGSYSLTIILLKNIEYFCTNCSEKSKIDAKIYGENQFIRVINPTTRRLIGEDINLAVRRMSIVRNSVLR